MIMLIFTVAYVVTYFSIPGFEMHLSIAYVIIWLASPANWWILSIMGWHKNLHPWRTISALLPTPASPLGDDWDFAYPFPFGGAVMVPKKDIIKWQFEWIIEPLGLFRIWG